MTTEILDVNKAIRTRSGYPVMFVEFDNKLMGVVKLDNKDGLFCIWEKTGEKVNLFPREKNEKHDLDLINLEI